MSGQAGESRKVSRRKLLKMGAGVACAMVGAKALATAAPALVGIDGSRTAAAGTGEQYDASKHAWAFAVDTTKCIGCGRCLMACKLENNVPFSGEYNRTWVERHVVTTDGKVHVDSPEGGIDGFPAAPEGVDPTKIEKSYFVPKLCNHCENPPCVSVCPVSATYRTQDGVVLVDQERCIGCGYCVVACPYGARYLVPRGARTPTGNPGVADKCTWCYHRITKGMQPACVEVCPVQARVFGDLKDEESPVSKVLAGKRTTVLKPELGTKPKVFYVGLENEVG